MSMEGVVHDNILGSVIVILGYGFVFGIVSEIFVKDCDVENL